MTGSSIQSLELRAGALRLAVRADLGACIAGLWHGETPVMRSVEPATLATSRQSSSYPLVPYSNRLGYMRFHWQGKDHATAPNFDDNPHSVHGVAWLRPWELVSSSRSDLALRYRHEPDAHWPFPFEVTQHFALTPQQLTVQLAFANTADIPQPVGLGWHPYFPKRKQSNLHIELTGRWDSDSTQLPTRMLAQPGIDGDVAQLNFDNCFEGWTGPALIRDEKFAIQLTSSESYLVVYTPPEKAYFCVEPVSHVSDAIHMADPGAHGLRTVAAGGTTSAWMKLDIQAL
jgi:aldose 1-epimerase